MKKISTRRITVIISPEDSSELRREGKPDSDKFDTRSPNGRSSFYSIWSREKKSSFPSGGTSPLYFSWNFPKRHWGREEGKGTAPLAFFLVPGNPQTRGLNLPPRSLSFAWVITLSFSHPFSSYTRPVPLILWFSVYLLQPLVFCRIFLRLLSSSRGILSRIPPPLFRFVLSAYRSFTFPRLWLSRLLL